MKKLLFIVSLFVFSLNGMSPRKQKLLQFQPPHFLKRWDSMRGEYEKVIPTCFRLSYYREAAAADKRQSFTALQYIVEVTGDESKRLDLIEKSKKILNNTLEIVSEFKPDLREACVRLQEQRRALGFLYCEPRGIEDMIDSIHDDLCDEWEERIKKGDSVNFCNELIERVGIEGNIPRVVELPS